MKPIKPIITDFEEVILPEDETQPKSKDFSVEDLSSVFNRLNNPNSEVSVSQEEKRQLNSDNSIAQSIEIQSENTSTQEQSVTKNTDTQSVVSVPQRDDGECPVSAGSIFEAVLFVGNADNDSYVTTESVCRLMPGVTEEDVSVMAEKLSKKWQEDNRPYRMECREGTQWRMVLDPKFEPVRDGFYTAVREFELPQSAINILGVLMYLQPMTAQEVGKKVGIDHPIPILNQLVKRNLLQVEKRITGEKKVNLYRTTQRFLDFFGLESLDDIPTIDEV